MWVGMTHGMNFNPLSPQGERPMEYEDFFRRYGISIHSPRKGRDGTWQGFLNFLSYFNPLSPQGERRLIHPVLP